MVEIYAQGSKSNMRDLPNLLLQISHHCTKYLTVWLSYLLQCLTITPEEQVHAGDVTY